VANIKSQIKRNRQNDKKRLRNRVYRGEARIAVKNARSTIDSGVPESKAAVLQAISALDKAAEQGVLHKNNVARRKSRLMIAFNKMEPAKIVEPSQMETSGEVEPVKKKAASGKTAAASSSKGKKVEEPKAAAETKKAEPKKASAAKKPAAKKTETKKPAAKKTTSKKSSAK
jgi:small subunit ribosomal protein S20